MENAVKRLAYTRSVEAEYKAEVAAAQAELETSGVWKYLEQQRQYLKTAEADVADAEVEVREQAMAVFAETGSKEPHPAVKIKMYAVLEYNDEDTIDYAREYLPEALKLDKRTFKQAAQAITMNFVAILQEPRATIARDLSRYLPED